MRVKGFSGGGRRHVSGGRGHAHCPPIDCEMTARRWSGSCLLLLLAALKSVAAVATYSTGGMHRWAFQRLEARTVAMWGFRTVGFYVGGCVYRFSDFGFRV